MIAVRRGDFFSGLALAALGTFVVAEALGWEYLTPDGPGAGFFPRWYGMAMIVLSLVLVVRSFRAAPVERRIHRGQHVLRQHIRQESQTPAVDADQRNIAMRDQTRGI